MEKKQDKLHLFISSDELKQLSRTLGEKISNDYRDKVSPGNELLVIVTLKGAMLFAADLIRELSVPVRLDFIRVASYGAGTQSSGKLQLTKDLEISPKDAHVLVLDEIVDSGRTLNFLIEKFMAAGCRSVKVCALLSKPSRREVQVKVDYLGKDIEDKFVVGYGLDYGERYRNLPDIYYIEG